MKKASLILLFIALGLTSCKKDALDVSFNSNLSATSDEVVVNDGTRVATSPYSTTYELDLKNTDTQDYLDRLKDVSLSDVKFYFNGLAALAGNQVPTNLSITINNQITFEFANFTYDGVAQGDPIMITDTAKIKQVAELLLQNKKVTIDVNGAIPDTAAHHFFIKMMAKAHITAKAL